jgi:endonuclease/exonuclease/phosphatase (EEP) superfamily protein YafD
MTEVIEEVDRGELKEAPLPTRSAMVHGLLVLVMFAAVLPSIAGLIGRWGWLLDLCNHFRFQYAILLTATTLGLLLLRSWRMALLSLTGLLLNLAFVLPLYLGSPGNAAPGPTLVVMHFNVNTANTDRAGVAAEINRHAPDLLFVQEVNPDWLDALDAALVDYERLVAEPRTDNFGIACYGRIDRLGDVTEARAYDITDGVSQIPTIEIAFEYDGRVVRVLSIHPLPPVSVDYAAVRNAVLDAAGEWSAKQSGPHLIVGDFNATPWSTAFRDMQAAGDLFNSQIGFGRAPTWPAGLGSLGMIPIDHLLHSGDFVTVERLVGDANGSDHAPLIVELGWRAAE